MTAIASAPAPAPARRSSGLTGYLARARSRTLDRHYSADDPVTYLYSGTTYALWRAAAAPTRLACTGLVLDAGSGRGGWRRLIAAAGGRRETLDIQPRPGEPLTWQADLATMPQVPSDRFDAAICHQVLEHVPDPEAALCELARILKPGGRLVLSVPHLSRLHELPHDYFRYTPAGMQALVRRAGMDVVSTTTYGGVLTFLHHQIATVVLGLAAALPPLFYIAFALNTPLSLLSVAFDRLLDRSHLMPNGVVLVARKPE